MHAVCLKCVSRDPLVLLRAARFTTGYVRLVGQEPAPGKCVLMSTSGMVRKDMPEWILSQEAHTWSVKLDLGGHLDTTFRGWSATPAARVGMVITRLPAVVVLPLDLHGRLRVVRAKFKLSTQAASCVVGCCLVASSATGSCWLGFEFAWLS